MAEVPATRPSLIVRLRDPRDGRAWAEFVDLYGPLVRDLARRRGLQAADAADLEQEVFRAVAGAIDRWDADPARGSFRAWLATIARRRILNALIALDRHPRGTGDTANIDRLAELPDRDPSADPALCSLFDTEHRRRLLAWALAQVQPGFQPTTWQAFWRTAVADEPVARVAADLGLSAGAVYVARSRVMARLRTLVAPFEPGDEPPEPGP